MGNGLGDSIGLSFFSFFFFSLSLSSLRLGGEVGGLRKISKIQGLNAHSLSPRGGTTSNLLDTELVKLGLQLLQLSVEVILVLSPELTSLDLGCRLQKNRNPSASPIEKSKTKKKSHAVHRHHGAEKVYNTVQHTMVGGFKSIIVQLSTGGLKMDRVNLGSFVVGLGLFWPAVFVCARR